MASDELRVVHVSPRVQAHGGIEALHAVHRTLPFAQSFVALFDRDPEPRTNYGNLNFTWRTTLGQMRRAFADALRPHAGSVVVYHNAWGLPFFAGVDGAARRVAFCHAMPAFHERDLKGAATLIDGVLSVTPALGEALPEWLPRFDRQRHCLLPLPVEPPAEIAPRHGGQEIVLGYAGRIVREHKRLDRLPAFLRALDATGLRYRFEVLGDGSLRSELERTLGDRVRFHGWTTKAEFWRVLGRWDGIVFFTEVEGGPIAMLEGMATGAIPFYPRIGGSTGDVYAPQVDAACYYPSGDLAAAAQSVREIFGRDPAAIAALRDRSRAAVAGHTRENYGETLKEFLNQIAASPRISRVGGPMRSWADPLPLGLVTRFARSLLRDV